METKQQTRGGKRPNAGRKKCDETITTGFRIHKESILICKQHNIKLNKKVNELVKKIAIELKELN